LILPFVEQQNLKSLYDTKNHWFEGTQNQEAASRVLSIYMCPTVSERMDVLSATISRPTTMTIAFAKPLGPADYEAIMGVQPSVNGAIYASQATNRSAMYRDSKVHIDQVVDGPSNTILLTECSARPLVFRGKQVRANEKNDQGQGWIDAEGAFSIDGANADGIEKGAGKLFAINATNTNEPYSFHQGGANMLFGDGRVQFISAAIPLETFAALCTRAGHESVDASQFLD
jgi:prepilin-type processing-associated H-X9-DG protein